MSTVQEYKLPGKRRNLSDKKGQKVKRVNRSVDELCLPELRNKQTFRVHQEQLEEIVGNEQQIKNMHRELY